MIAKSRVVKVPWRPLTALLILCLSASAALASAQLTVLASSDSQPYAEMIDGLRGSVEGSGTDAHVDIFYLDGDSRKAEMLIDSLKIGRPDLIVTLGNLALDAAADQIGDIPIVAGMIMTKEKIQSHQNVTGVVLEIPIDVQFAWLRKFFPTVQKIGVFYNPVENNLVVHEAVDQARRLGLNLVAEPIDSPQDLPNALKRMAGEVEVVWGLSDPVVLNKKTAQNILLFSFRNKIPFVGLSQAWVKAGAYYALDRDYYDIGVQCGEMVGRILEGAAVETILPATPRKITYSINTKMAEKMDRKIEQSLINAAAQVF